MMINITPEISLDENELRFEFVRSSGPGGQNVNKVSTAAQLRFDVRGSPNLKHDVRERLIKLAGRKMTRDGVLIIHANTCRSQEKNREDAVRRLSHLIKEASRVPRHRKKTKPTLASKTKRIESKRKRSKVKEMRRSVFNTSD
jgi:ribosome-associated protein